MSDFYLRSIQFFGSSEVMRFVCIFTRFLITRCLKGIAAVDSLPFISLVHFIFYIKMWAQCCSMSNLLYFWLVLLCASSNFELCPLFMCNSLLNRSIHCTLSKSGVDEVEWAVQYIFLHNLFSFISIKMSYSHVPF